MPELDRSVYLTPQVCPGPPAAFDLPIAVGKHYGFMYALARDHVHPKDADDLVHSAVARALHVGFEARGDENNRLFQAWLRKVVATEHIDQIRADRANKRQWRSSGRPDWLPPSQEDAVFLRQLFRRISQLPAHQRELIRAAAAGASFAELAEQFRIPLGTVKSRLARARAALARNT